VLLQRKILVDKAVFCVDNVSSSVSVDDLKSFVSGMHMNVFVLLPYMTTSISR